MVLSGFGVVASGYVGYVRLWGSYKWLGLVTSGLKSIH